MKQLGLTLQIHEPIIWLWIDYGFYFQNTWFVLA